MTMVGLFKHLGHSTRTVAKGIVQKLEKERVVRNLKAVEQRQTNGNGLTHECTFHLPLSLIFTQMGV